MNVVLITETGNDGSGPELGSRWRSYIRSLSVFEIGQLVVGPWV